MKRVLCLIGAVIMLGGVAIVGTPAQAVLAKPAGVPISWHKCPGEATVQCGSLRLPVDWAHPHGATFKLALARRKATDPKSRIGSLLVNPGGPGGSGVDFAQYGDEYFSANLRKHFDIVGFDPRGVARSHPVVCSTQALQHAGNNVILPTTSAAFARLTAYNRQLANDCRKHTGPLFDHLDSVSVAHDIDAIRIALGEQKISWYGVSYGTLLGQMYAELYPRHIRGMVLDSNMDHSVRTPTFLLTQAATVEDSFAEFAKWCDRTKACALHGRSVQAVWKALLARADAGKLTDPFYPQRISAFELIDSTTSYLPGPYWSDLAAWLESLRSGKSDGDAARMSRSRPDTELEQDPFPAIFCEDWNLPVHGAHDMAWLWRLSKAVAPNMRTSMLGLGAVTGCIGWPAKVQNPQHRLHVSRSAPTLYVVNALHDPSTPYAWAVADVRQLGRRAAFVTYNGWGHGTYGRSSCTTDLPDRYLITLKVPARGTHCAAATPSAAAAALDPARPAVTVPRPRPGVGGYQR